jgi:xanthine dehydrogenase YagR molybdenum-binding subunit
MKFDSPAITNPVDRKKVIGQSVDRVDGLLKTTGRATYAYEQDGAVPGAAYGYIIGSAIAKGRITSIDVTAARRAPGVLGVVTAREAGPLGTGAFYMAPALAGPEVQHYHQAVAVVVADSFEQARAASALVKVEYAPEQGAFDLDAARCTAVAPEGFSNVPPAETRVGDFEGAFASAAVKVDATFTTPDQAHAMMEPHATIAAWSDGNLTIWTAIQQVAKGVADLAATLGIANERIRIISPFIGGGFGGKATVLSDAVLASLAARAVSRPVKVSLQRPLMFNNTTHRPATIQRVRIGASADGHISAIAHESWSGNIARGKPEPTVISTRLLYAGNNRLTRLWLAHLDLPEGSAMRAPGEAPGMMALEIAMDEMAEKLRMDPVEFRVMNDIQVDPENPQRPFSTRQLVKCLRDGASHFGWDARYARPSQRWEGRWLIGLGVAAAIRGAPIATSSARVRLDNKGMLTVETDMTDIGTGSYTICAQTAAEVMGIPMKKIQVRLGSSEFPPSPGSGGQQGGPSVTAGVYAACMKLREAIAQSLGLDADSAQFTDERVRIGSRAFRLRDAVKGRELVAQATMEYGDLNKRYVQNTFGAHFVEVGVHSVTGEIRVRRMLAVCAAGRILNPKLARSQIIGGMTMGVGAALMETLAVDKRHGCFINHDLVGYEVPVHADIPHQEVMFIDEVDPTMSPVKAKGVGELGISGVAAAVANAVYNATGLRVRDYPITLDKFVDRLPRPESR